MGPQLPSPSTSAIDIRSQIIDNCKFLVGKDDSIQVIVGRDPTGKHSEAYAIRRYENTREVMFVSESCEDAQNAMENLLKKSSEAIHKYMTANDFSSRCDLKAAILELNADDDDDNDDDDDVASIISNHSESSTAALSEWGSSGDEAGMPQHAPDMKEAPKDRQRPTNRQDRRTVAAAGARGPVEGSRSRTAVRDVSDAAPLRGRPVRPTRSRSPPAAFRQAPPSAAPSHPVHTSPNRPPAAPPSMGGMQMPPPLHPNPMTMAIGPLPHRNRMNPPAPPMQPPTCYRVPTVSVDRPPFPPGQGVCRPPKPSGPDTSDSNNGNRNGNNTGNHPMRPFSVFHPTMRTYTVRITVNWLRHGQHRIISQCQPTRESLQSAAVRDVRTNPGAFSGSNPGTKGTVSPGNGNNRDNDRPIIRAHVRQAVFSGEPYDLRTFHGQDLSRLFHVMAADDSIPSFEVVVEDVSHNAKDDDDDDDDDDDALSIMGFPGTTNGGRWD